MTPEEEAAEAIRKLKEEIDELTKSSEYLRAGFKTLKPDTWGDKILKGVNASIYKSMSNAGRAAEEEAVRQAKLRGASELEQDAARARARMASDKKSAERAYQADEALSGFGKGIGKTAGAIGGFAKSMGNAELGFKQLNPIIDAVATAFSGIPILGGVVKAAAEASKFMIEQLQNATDAFHDVAKVGGLTAEGMSGLQKQFLTSGMQLKSFTKTVADNSAALANFGGSVGKGAEIFSQTAGTVQKDFGRSLQRLGFGIDEIGETTASYIARQTRLGLAQGKSVETLSAGAAKYAVELDELAKLTGASKNELKKQQDEALSEARFRATIDEMLASGDEKKIKEANNLIASQSALDKQNKGLGRAFRDSVSGFVGTSQEAVQGFMATGGQMTDIVERAKNADPSTVLEMTRSAVKDNLDIVRSQAKFGNEFAGNYAGLSDFAKGMVRDGKGIQETQQSQMSNGDKLTNQTVDAQRSMQQMSIEIQKLGFTYMPAAAGAVKSFTGALNKLTKIVSEKTGADKVTIGPDGSTTTEASGSSSSSGKGTGKVRGIIAVADYVTSSSNDQPGGRRVIRGTTNATRPGPEVGAGPAFSRPDMTWNDKVLLTLEEMRDEVKKLTKMGAVASGPAGAADMTAAMNAHDASHKHEPPTVTPEAAAALGKGMGSPLKDLKVTSGFGMRTDPITGKQAGHGGVDLAGKIGDAIMAPDSGIARVVGEAQSGGYGNMVEILNEQGKVIHRMAHMSEAMVKTGDKITAGTQIGKVGSTGRSTGAHLHWEQFDPTTGKQIDPMAALAARQGQTTQVAGATPGAVPGMPEGPIMAKSELKGQQKEFYDKLYATLLAEATKAGVKNPEAIARLGAAQSSLETGYGKSTAGGNNYFGIKGGGGNQQTTQEWDAKQGKMVTIKDSFRKYDSMESSAADYIKMMQGSQRYAGVLGAGSTAEAIAAQGKSGYATDPDYARKLAMITSSATGQGIALPGGIAGPSGVPTPYAAAPGATNVLPPVQTAAAPAPSPAPGPGGADPTMMAQLVAINREQNVLLARILQTSQS